METMKPINGFKNYTVTSDGRVWSRHRKGVKGRWLKTATHRSGHLYVSLCVNGKQFYRHIHRLVLEAYVGPRPAGMECRHLNGNPTDNQLDNLCWGTRSENIQDAIQHGTHPGFKNNGENNGQAKLTEKDAQFIFDSCYNGTHTRRELTSMFPVSRTTINGIANRRKWRCLSPMITRHHPTTQHTRQHR